MTPIEEFKEYINNRLEELNPKKGEFMGRPLRDVNPKTFPRESELEKMLAFIESREEDYQKLEEAKAQSLEETARRYLDKVYAEKGHQDENGNPHIPYYCVQEAFLDGAKWIAKQLENKE